MKLIALYGMLFVAWGTALLGFIHWETSRYQREVLDQIIQQRVQFLLGVERERLPDTLTAANGTGSFIQIGLFSATGDVVSGKLLSRPATLPADGKIRELTDTLRLSDGSVMPHVRAVATPLPGGEILVTVRDASTLDRIGGIIGRALLWGLSLTIIPGIVGGLLVARGPRRRIEQIRQATDLIIAGDLARRLPLSGRGDELDMLAAIVNRMLGEIERLIGEVKGVCDNIAHDLRTPLTRLRAQLHRLRQQTPCDDLRADALDRCIVDTDALLDRFRALLRISEIEDLHRRAGFKLVDLTTTLRQVHELYVPLAEDKGVHFALDLDSSVAVAADAGLMFEALSNLVSNAIKFTPPGGQVTLRASASAAGMRIDVIDNGPGIPPAEREAVLQRFYRSQSGRDAEGFGLGLSIVAAIVRLHSFQLEIAAADGNGTRASLRCWPAALVGTPLETA